MIHSIHAPDIPIAFVIAETEMELEEDILMNIGTNLIKIITDESVTRWNKKQQINNYRSLKY